VKPTVTMDGLGVVELGLAMEEMVQQRREHPVKVVEVRQTTVTPALIHIR
jgi:hypothetical protein